MQNISQITVDSLIDTCKSLNTSKPTIVLFKLDGYTFMVRLSTKACCGNPRYGYYYQLVMVKDAFAYRNPAYLSHDRIRRIVTTLRIGDYVDGLNNIKLYDEFNEKQLALYLSGCKKWLKKHETNERRNHQSYQ